MRNFVMKNYIKNRNSLRYLITNPFTEPPSYTILKFIKANRYIILDKEERVTPEYNSFSFRIRRIREVITVKVHISKDHLIKITISPTGKISKLKKTRVIEEALLFIQENLR